jgi:hypothetical protein
VKGHGNEKKGKKNSLTCQGTLNFVECTLKNSHKTFEMKNFKTSHCLKFSETLENVALH